MTDAHHPAPTPIYYLHPLMVGPLRDWGAELDRIAALGFRVVAIPPPFAPARSGDMLLVADHDHPHPSLEAPGDGTDAISRIAAACSARGLALMLDLVVDRVAAGGALAATHPRSYGTAGSVGERPDPRRPAPSRDAAYLDLASADVAAWWGERVRTWVTAGVAGFRCETPGRVPPALWRGLVTAARAARPDCGFVAWTAGMLRGEIEALAGVGFSLLCSSAAWWDYRAGWLMEERAALDRIAPSLAFPEAPFGTRAGADIADTGLRERGARRALHFAARFGDALLVPMGFEFGARRALDPSQDRPGDWVWLRENAPYDLSAEMGALCAAASREAVRAGMSLDLTGPGSPVVAVLRARGQDPRTADGGALLLANPALDVAASVLPETLLPAMGGLLGTPRATSPGREMLLPGVPVVLEPGEVRVYAVPRGAPVLRPKSARPTPAQAVDVPRVAIEAVTPLVDGGRFPIKRTVGDRVDVEADVFTDGHGKLGVALLWRAADERGWRETRMTPLANDRWAASFPLARLGRHQFAVEAWMDVFATFRDELTKKRDAGINVTLEVEEGRRLVAATAARHPGGALAELAARLEGVADAEKLSALLAPDTAALMAAADDRPHRVRQNPVATVEAERTAASFASWFEVFPRSQSGDARRHGTFADVIGRLPAIRDMGFDVLYFPPIHPIGRRNRKGPNNTLTPGPDDPGSPYAIGSDEGGHEALHPELGTLEDFERLRAAAAGHGLELAMDFAIQCAPDHPWLAEHPEWFDWRPDGSLRYAENPPKKYQDIVNVDFYAAGATPSLWVALRDSVMFWADRGIRTFRVDNPHTKPLPFWEWMIAEIKAKYPDAIFLSEAFTRPKVMYRLAKVGFSQSYTYFTWRNSKRDLQDYMVELTTTAPREFFRPHFFVNTPDINPYFLQTSGRPGHLLRAALAATLSGLWGVYNGFELCEATPIPGKEEYLDSEKFQLRAWDYDRPGNIVPEITRLNAIRKANPALHSHLNVRFHNAYNDNILYFSKATRDRSNVLLVAISLDPDNVQEASFELPLWEWNLPDDASLEAEDLMRGQSLTWTGKTQRLRLDPADLPFAIWRVRPAGA